MLLIVCRQTQSTADVDDDNDEGDTKGATAKAGACLCVRVCACARACVVWSLFNAMNLDAAVDEVVGIMSTYGLLREDWDSACELLAYEHGTKDWRDGIESKVKAAFTRQLNKAAHAVRYAGGGGKRAAAGVVSLAHGEEGDDDDDDADADMAAAAGDGDGDDDDDGDDVLTDLLIKQKKRKAPAAAKATKPPVAKKAKVAK